MQGMLKLFQWATLFIFYKHFIQNFNNLKTELKLQQFLLQF